MIKFAGFLIVFLLTGCAANQPVQQVGNDEYVLYRVDHAGVFGNPQNLRNSVLSDANAFAEQRGKIAVPISAKTHPVGILGDFGSFQYTFRLADKTDKYAATIHLLPDSDVVVDGNGKVLPGKNAQSPIDVDRMYSELTKLEKLKDEGIISPDEFETQKKRILLEH